MTGGMECNETTSEATCPSAAASGRPSLALCALSPVRSLPRLASRRRNFSLARLAPTPPLAPIAVPPVTVTPEDVEDELDYEWRRLEGNAGRREYGRGRGGVGWRCWDCFKIVVGPLVTCIHCGYRHGGVNHPARSL